MKLQSSPPSPLTAPHAPLPLQSYSRLVATSVEEVALEGPSGCTHDRLWQALAQREEFARQRTLLAPSDPPLALVSGCV